MTITINSKTLLTALNLTAKGINNTSISDTSNYRARRIQEGLEISTCNLEISMQTKVSCEIAEDIDILIPAEKITRLLSALPDQSISINIADDLEITITAASGSYSLSGYPGFMFPEIKIETNSEATINVEDLVEALYITSYARSTDQTQFKFTGLSVIVDKEKMQFAGCNQLVLSVFNVKGAFLPAKLLLPPSIVNAVSGLNIPGVVKISYSDNSICFEYDNLVVKSLLMDEKYPDYMGHVPKNEIKITADRQELLSAVSRVLDFSNKEKKIELNSLNGDLAISGRDTAYKQFATENLKVDGGDIEIGLNGQLFAESLKRVSSELVEIYWQAFNVAIIIREPGDLENFIMVMAMINL